MKRKNPFRKYGIRICLIYMIIGIVWIYTSDKLVTSLISNRNTLFLASSYKGLVYVIATAVILYFLINNLINKIISKEEELKKQYNQIVAYDKELSYSEQKYKTLIQQMDLGFALFEGKAGEHIDQYQLVDINDCFTKLTGISFKQNNSLFSELFRDIDSKLKEKLMHTITTGKPMRYEHYQDLTNRFTEIIAYRPRIGQLAVIANDITARKATEQAIRISENNLRNIYEGSSDAIFIIDNHIISDCNLSAVKLLNYADREHIVENPIYAFSPIKQPSGIRSRELFEQYLEETRQHGKCRFEWCCQTSSGELITTEIVLTTILSHDKQVYQAMCRDINERKKLEERLHYLSYRDQLTGAYNRRHFEEELIRLNDVKYFPLTLTMADINGLKLINDSFGHSVGDEYIQKVTETISNECRKQDIVCRLSGDEFIIISPNTIPAEADAIILNIQKKAVQESIRHVALSISFGYSTRYLETESFYDVLKIAEDNMYKNKLFEGPSMRGKTIKTIITTLHEKNPREEQHSHRVSQLCESMGRVIGLTDEKIKELRTVGLLHDIGKVAIDERILNKNGKLTEEEFAEIKKHPEIGYRILSTVNDFSEMAEYVLAHHERWDGKGYPKGLKGDEIPVQARIIAIADAYDAMVSERSYRKPLTKEQAIAELRSGAGTQFYEDFIPIFIEKVLQD